MTSLAVQTWDMRTPPPTVPRCAHGRPIGGNPCIQCPCPGPPARGNVNTLASHMMATTRYQWNSKPFRCVWCQQCKMLRSGLPVPMLNLDQAPWHPPTTVIIEVGPKPMPFQTLRAAVESIPAMAPSRAKETTHRIHVMPGKYWDGGDDLPKTTRAHGRVEFYPSTSVGPIGNTMPLDPAIAARFIRKVPRAKKEPTP